MAECEGRPDIIELSLSRDELVALNNSLAYVCSAVELAEFATVIGVDRRAARKLLRRLSARLSGMPQG